MFAVTQEIKKRILDMMSKSNRISLTEKIYEQQSNRECSVCEIIKPKEEFYVCGGRRVWKCKPCYQAYQRITIENRKKERERIITSGKKIKIMRKKCSCR
jgi:hypothetical protein